MLFSITYLLPMRDVADLRGRHAVRLRLRGAGLPRARRGADGRPTRAHKRELRSRDGFLLVTLGVGADVGDRHRAADARPCRASRFTDAFFETMSGLSTTGATVLTGLDSAAAVDQPVAPRAQLVRRHGHHRAGRGDPADARRRRHAALQGRDARPDQGREADAAHHRRRRRRCGRLLPDHGRLHPVAQARRHELVRRGLPLLRDAWRSAASRRTTPASGYFDSPAIERC